VTIICGIGLGLLAGWVSDRYGVSENVFRAAAYTVGIFVLLAMALRPTWRRLRLWLDLAGLSALHVALSTLRGTRSNPENHPLSFSPSTHWLAVNNLCKFSRFQAVRSTAVGPALSSSFAKAGHVPFVVLHKGTRGLS